MVGLGQREGREHLAARDRHEPPRLLLVAAEERDRAQRQAALDRDDRAERPVAARDLHVHESRRERRRVPEPRVHEAVVVEVELAHAPGEVEVVLAAVPGPSMRGPPRRCNAFARSQTSRSASGDVGEDRVVVGAETVGDVVARDALAGNGGSGSCMLLAALLPVLRHPVHSLTGTQFMSPARCVFVGVPNAAGVGSRARAERSC